MSEHDLWLFTYKNALGREKHMAIYEPDKSKALNLYAANKEPTDRLVSEQPMTKRQYREWLKQ